MVDLSIVFGMFTRPGKSHEIPLNHHKSLGKSPFSYGFPILSHGFLLQKSHPVEDLVKNRRSASGGSPGFSSERTVWFRLRDGNSIGTQGC